MKTLGWAAGLMGLLCTLCSVIAVEYIHPMMNGLEAEGHYSGCTWCASAFKDSVHANLTFFQMISGDGWGSLSRPIIEHAPLTAVLFFGIIFVCVFGLLNLVIAAIVDTAAEAREADHATLGKLREKDRQESWARFQEQCQTLDKDISGDISLQELRQGLAENPSLKATLSELGVGEADLTMLFHVLDADGNNELTCAEFADQLCHMNCSEVKTSLFYIRKYVEAITRQLEKQEAKNTCSQPVVDHTCRQSQMEINTLATNPPIQNFQSNLGDIDGFLESLKSAEESVNHMLQELQRHIHMVMQETMPTSRNILDSRPCPQAQEITDTSTGPVPSELLADSRQEGLWSGPVPSELPADSRQDAICTWGKRCVRPKPPEC